MFVVAIVSSFYDDDAGRDRQVILDNLYETTEGAKAEISRMIFEAKKEIFLGERESHIREGFDKKFREKYPEPPNVYYSDETKPKFDHNRASDKEYQKAHGEAVAAWRKDVFNPALDRHDAWAIQRREFVERNALPLIEDVLRFVKTSLKDEINAVELPDYEYGYSTKVLEIFK